MKIKQKPSSSPCHAIEITLDNGSTSIAPLSYVLACFSLRGAIERHKSQNETYESVILRLSRCMDTVNYRPHEGSGIPAPIY